MQDSPPPATAVAAVPSRWAREDAVGRQWRSEVVPDRCWRRRLVADVEGSGQACTQGRMETFAHHRANENVRWVVCGVDGWVAALSPFCFSSVAA